MTWVDWNQWPMTDVITHHASDCTNHWSFLKLHGNVTVLRQKLLALLMLLQLSMRWYVRCRGRLLVGTVVAFMLHLFVTYSVENRAFNHVVLASSSSWLQEHVTDMSERLLLSLLSSPVRLCWLLGVPFGSPTDPALCGSCPLVTPYYCRLEDLLCCFVYIILCVIIVIIVFSCFCCFLSLL